MSNRICYHVAPRYTCGSPALVDERTARKVAAQEQEAYRRALDGIYGEQAQQLAAHLGLDGIAEVHVVGAHWYDFADLITEARGRRYSAGHEPRGARGRRS